MKLKAILGVVGLTAVSAVAQPVDITITGATAFRTAAYRSVADLFNPGYAVTASGSNPTNSSRATLSGTMALFGSRPVTIRLSWSGSVKGIQDVVQGNAVPTRNTDGTTANIIPTFTFADNKQSSTAFTSPVLDTTEVGVITFAWVRSVFGTAGITNISSSQARTLLGAGVISRGYFTGDSTDATPLYAVGRDTGSGTRVITHADTGFGINGGASLYGTNAGSCTFVQSPGYTSGGFVRDTLNGCSTPAIGYAAIADANGVAGGANKLTYNGVAYSENAVKNGQYTFWSYEIFGNRSGLNADAAAFRSAIVAAVPLNIGADGIKLTDMNVERFDDGADIFPLY